VTVTVTVTVTVDAFCVYAVYVRTTAHSEICQLLQAQALELEDKYEDTVGTLVQQATVQSGVHTALQLMLAAQAGAEVAVTSAAVTLLTAMQCGPADCDTPTPYELYELDSSSTSESSGNTAAAAAAAAGSTTAAATAGDSHSDLSATGVDAQLSFKLSVKAISTEADSSAATVRHRVPKTASSVRFSDERDDASHSTDNNSSYSSGGSNSSNSSSSRGRRSNSANDFTGYVDSYVEDCDELPTSDTATAAIAASTTAGTDAASSALVCVNTDRSSVESIDIDSSTAAAVAAAAADVQAGTAHAAADTSSKAAVHEERDIMQLLHAIGESHRAATARHLIKTERLTRELHEARAEAGV
jgi:hypothetical protein